MRGLHHQGVEVLECFFEAAGPLPFEDKRNWLFPYKLGGGKLDYPMVEEIGSGLED
jgi:hypothetical protein